MDVLQADSIFFQVSSVLLECPSQPDLHATMTAGVVAVMVDPRTSLAQCLEAALLTELADNAGWEVLVDLATQGGDAELAKSFVLAQEEEAVHLEDVKRWLAAWQSR